MTPRAADWEALWGAIAGEAVLPGALAYESVRKPAMARFENVRPAAVILCQAPEDAAEAIGFARRFRVHKAIRGGGHSVVCDQHTDRSSSGSRCRARRARRWWSTSHEGCPGATRAR